MFAETVLMNLHTHGIFHRNLMEVAFEMWSSAARQVRTSIILAVVHVKLDVH
jgi:hypothetical protein